MIFRNWCIAVLLLAPFFPAAQSQEPGSSYEYPFTSLTQASGITVPNMYYFNLDGQHPFKTYVNGIGEVLVAMSYGSPSSMNYMTEVSNTQSGILSPSVLSSLSDAAQIRVTSSSAAAINKVTTEPELIARLRNNTPLYFGSNDDYNPATAWPGGSGTISSSANCFAPSSFNLGQVVIYSCGSQNGIVWVPAADVYTDGTATLTSTQYLQLWVKGSGGTATPPVPVITGLTTTSGQVSVAFSSQISGTNAVSFAVATGSALPPGLSLNPTNGYITGMPMAAGTYTFSVTATNSTSGTSAPYGLSITISQPQNGAPVITSPSTANGVIGTNFSFTIAGTSATSYGVTGTLPAGLSLNTATGEIHGTLTNATANSYPLTVSATNGAGTSTGSLTITIAQPGTSNRVWMDNMNGGIYNRVLTNNVGIGTSTPGAMLDVNGGTNISGTLKLGATAPQVNGGNVLLMRQNSNLPNTAGGYLYPFEIQASPAENLLRFQISPYRRAANPGFIGTAFRMQYAVDASFTDGGKAFVEVGGDDPHHTYGGFISLATEGLDRLTVNSLGNVCIGNVSGTGADSYLLNVAGPVRANKLTVNTTGADFVFEPSYKLKPLAVVEEYVKRNKHLPGISTAAEMQENGIEVGENQTKLLQKVEELTLYAIAQDKQQETQNKKIGQQQRLITEQGKLLQSQQKLLLHLLKKLNGLDKKPKQHK